MGVASAAAVGIFGALVAIAWALIQIDDKLRRIARELERTREDNATWRQNTWDRDSRR